MNRRYFFLSTAAAAAGLRASGLASPNDTIRIGIAGVRGQGRAHIREFSGMKNVQIAALCDIDESVLDARLAEIEKMGLPRPARYVSFRKMLEDRSIDAVSIATPNHSHALQTIWACQAGKDVYVEKPCSHNMFESRQIVAAARKYNRLVQHGTNSRSTAGLKEAVGHLREGLIGDIYMARGLCFKWRDTIGRAPEEPVPPGVHYDEWLGPAPVRPFTRNRFHYNWHWFWDYGNGDFGNQGIHQLDICRWGLGVTYPTKVSAMGGHFMFDDDQETPNTLVVTYEFNGRGNRRQLMVFEVRHWITNNEAGIGEREGKRGGNTVGNIFYGSKGYMAIDGYATYKTFLGREQQRGPARSEGGSNFKNFIDALRTRRREDLNAEIEEGAISCDLMHLGNIAYRVGRTLEFDPTTMQVKNDPEANRLFKRSYRPPYVVPERA
jgi:predicted dehydrogenase